MADCTLIGLDWLRAFQVFLDLDFTLLEMNPFTLDSDGNPFPLDMRGELDDTAAFKSGKKWGSLEFPLPFGRSMTSAEEHVHELDSNTGKSACYLDTFVLCSWFLLANLLNFHPIYAHAFCLSAG